MADNATERFPRGDGLTDDVLTHFGVSRQVFVRRLREILLKNPPEGLDDVDVAYLLATCS
ncbi:MAG: hypothetical protein WBQ44_09520 [Rhodococcus sp. (in: high G+C Gram-positive bacteria)]